MNGALPEADELDQHDGDEHEPSPEEVIAAITDDDILDVICEGVDSYSCTILFNPTDSFR